MEYLSVRFLRCVTAAQAKILGPEDVYVKRGSTISLTCTVNVQSTPPSSVSWHHGGAVVDFDSPRYKPQESSSQFRPSTPSHFSSSFFPHVHTFPFDRERAITIDLGNLDVSRAPQSTSSRQAPEGVDFSGRHSAIPPIERKASEYLTFNPSVATRQFAVGASRVKKASDVLIRQFCPELVSNIISERK